MISHFMSAQQRVTSKESMTIPAFPITVIRQRSNFPNLHASCQYSEETGIVAGGRHTKTHPWTRRSQVSPVFTSVPLALCPYLPSISAAHPQPQHKLTHPHPHRDTQRIPFVVSHRQKFQNRFSKMDIWLYPHDMRAP